MFKEKSNPVGVAQNIPEIEKKIINYAIAWDEQSKKWRSKIDFSKITNFLLLAMDDFIVILGEKMIPGADKKATVLDAVDKLYEYVIKEAMPIWMKPFAKPIKHFIIYILVSSAIDWVVMKYNQGSWKVQKSALDRILEKAGCLEIPCRARRKK